MMIACLVARGSRIQGFPNDREHEFDERSRFRQPVGSTERLVVFCLMVTHQAFHRQIRQFPSENGWMNSIS